MSFGKKTFDPGDAASNRRGGPRRRLLKAGWLVFNEGRSTIDCTLRDLSDTGARVAVNGPFDCPEWVTLRVRDGLTYTCELRWQRKSEIGLRFTTPPRAAETPQSRRVNAWALYQLIEKMPPNEPLRMLRNVDFVGDPAVREAAELWAGSYEQLVAALMRVHRKQEEDEEAGAV